MQFVRAGGGGCSGVDNNRRARQPDDRGAKTTWGAANRRPPAVRLRNSAPGEQVAPRNTFQKMMNEGGEVQPVPAPANGTEPAGTPPSEGGADPLDDALKSNSNANYFEAPKLFNPERSHGRPRRRAGPQCHLREAGELSPSFDRPHHGRPGAAGRGWLDQRIEVVQRIDPASPHARAREIRSRPLLALRAPLLSILLIARSAPSTVPWPAPAPTCCRREAVRRARCRGCPSSQDRTVPGPASRATCPPGDLRPRRARALRSTAAAFAGNCFNSSRAACTLCSYSLRHASAIAATSGSRTFFCSQSGSSANCIGRTTVITVPTAPSGQRYLFRDAGDLLADLRPIVRGQHLKRRLSGAGRLLGASDRPVIRFSRPAPGSAPNGQSPG